MTIKVIEIDLGRDKNITAGTKLKPFMTTEEANYQYINNNTNRAIFGKLPTMMYNILARMRFIYNSPSKTNAAKYLIENLEGRKLFFCSSIDQAESLSPTNYHSKTDNKNSCK